MFFVLGIVDQLNLMGYKPTTVYVDLMSLQNVKQYPCQSNITIRLLLQWSDVLNIAFWHLPTSALDSSETVTIEHLLSWLVPSACFSDDQK